VTEDHNTPDRRERGSDRIERELRAAFPLHPAQPDPDSISRLRTINYRPGLSVAQRIQGSIASVVRWRTPPK
jgi:hypothetical protein